MNNKQRYLVAGILVVIAVVDATTTLHFGYFQYQVDGQGIRLADPTLYDGALGIWARKSTDYGALGAFISLIALVTGSIYLLLGRAR